MSDEDREVPIDTPEIIEAKLKHAERLRMWHRFEGPYANASLPPPKLKLPKRQE